MKISRILLLSLILIPRYAYSQISALDIESNIREAQADYDSGYYVESHKEFAALADSFPDDSHNSVFRFMAAKSLFKAGDYKDAASLWNEFSSEFPTSSLLGAAYLFNGHCEYFQKDLLSAASDYIKAIDFAPKSEEGALAKDNLNPLIQRGLTLTELTHLVEDNPGSITLEELEFTLADREIKDGRYRKGIATLKIFVAKYPGSRHFKQAKVILSAAEQKLKDDMVLGLLAPVTGPFKEYGRSMIEAAQLAIKQYKPTNTKIELIISDTEGDPIITAKSAMRMVDEEPVGVVGPLRSESAICSAIVFNEHNIPMITPTASQNGLSSIGANIFQISPSGENISRAIAKFAVRNLKINEFAIISPDDNEGTHISNSFAQAVYEAGGEIIQTIYYPTGTTDFKQYLTPLREILLANIEDKLSAGIIDSAEFLDSKYGELLPREDWHVKLGGIFIPGSIEDLKLLIPQIKYNGISTRLLGSDSWDSPDLMREVKNYVDNAVFATDFHPNSKDVTWYNFEKAYESEYHHIPDKVAALTYDAINLILAGISRGYSTPESLRQYLSEIDNYQGASAVITFRDCNRANDEVGVYSIDGRRLNK